MIAIFGTNPTVNFGMHRESGVAQLLARLEPVKQAGLPIYIVDYVPADNIALADATSARISGYGFHPLIVPQQLHGIILAPRPPSITVQPQGGTVWAGNSFTFSTSVAGTPPFSFQWRLDERDIAGAQAGSYARSDLDPSASGRYSVVIRNAAGAATSAAAVLTVQIHDSDGDLLPDDWERTYGLRPDDGSDALKDADGDASSNLDEDPCGTNPRDPLSCLRIALRRVSATEFRLSFDAMAKQSYTIQTRESLSSPQWLRLRDVEAQNLNSKFEMTLSAGPPGTTNKARFFRVLSPRAP